MNTTASELAVKRPRAKIPPSVWDPECDDSPSPAEVRARQLRDRLAQAGIKIRVWRTRLDNEDDAPRELRNVPAALRARIDKLPDQPVPHKWLEVRDWTDESDFLGRLARAVSHQPGWVAETIEAAARLREQVEWEEATREARRREALDRRLRSERVETQRFLSRRHHRATSSPPYCGASVLELPPENIGDRNVPADKTHDSAPWIERIYALSLEASAVLQDPRTEGRRREAVVRCLTGAAEIEQEMRAAQQQQDENPDLRYAWETLRRLRTTAESFVDELHGDLVRWFSRDPETSNLTDVLDRVRGYLSAVTFDPVRMRAVPAWHESAVRNETRRTIRGLLAPALPKAAQARLVKARPWATGSTSNGDCVVETEDNLTDGLATARHRECNIAYYEAMSAALRLADPNRIFGIRVEWTEYDIHAPCGMWRRTAYEVGNVIAGALKGLATSEFCGQTGPRLHEKDGCEFGLIADFHPDGAAVVGHAVCRTPEEAEQRMTDVRAAVEAWRAAKLDGCRGPRPHLEYRVESFPKVRADQIVFPEWAMIRLDHGVDYTTGYDPFEELSVDLPEEERARRRRAAARDRDTRSRKLLKAYLAQADLEDYYAPDPHGLVYTKSEWRQDEPEDEWHRIVESLHPRYRKFREGANVPKDEDIPYLGQGTAKKKALRTTWGRGYAYTFSMARNATQEPSASCSWIRKAVWARMFDRQVTLEEAVTLEAYRIVIDVAREAGVAQDEINQLVVALPGGRKSRGLVRHLDVPGAAVLNRKHAAKLLLATAEGTYEIEDASSKMLRQIVAAGLVKTEYIPESETQAIIEQLKLGTSTHLVAEAVWADMIAALTGEDGTRRFHVLGQKLQEALAQVQCPLMTEAAENTGPDYEAGFELALKRGRPPR